MRFSERIKSSSLTDWLLTLFTAVLAAAAIYQFIIMGGQLDTMRKDQRAWVSIIQKGPIVLNVGVTPSEVVTISNTGKTPAKHVAAHFYVEIVPNGKAPHFEESAMHSIVLYGSIPPNLPQRYRDQKKNQGRGKAGRRGGRPLPRCRKDCDGPRQGMDGRARDHLV